MEENNVPPHNSQEVYIVCIRPLVCLVNSKQILIQYLSKSLIVLPKDRYESLKSNLSSLELEKDNAQQIP